MLFERIANLSSKDYIDAADYVIASEQDNFVRYFTLQWSPWVEVLKRLNPDGYQSAENKIGGYLRSEEYDRQIEDRLSTLVFEDGNAASDARIQVGQVVSDEIREEAIVNSTRTLLDSRGLIDLLDRPALPDMTAAAAIAENPQGASGSQSH